MKKVAQCAFTIISFIAYGNTSNDTTLQANLTIDCGVTRFGQAWEESMEEKRYGKRIINGIRARVGQFSWSARLGNTYDEYNYNYTLFHCGGSLISRTFVISAAHCDVRTNIVRLGQTTLITDQCDKSGVCAPPYQDIAVKRFMFEDFCRASRQNDIMLVELDRPAELNDFVTPICLPAVSASAKDFVGKKVYASGWGLQNPNDENSGPTSLLYIPMIIQDPNKCKSEFPHMDGNTQLCLGSYRRQHICSGDSGNGDIYFENTDGVTRAYLVGVVSYGTRSCLHDSIHTYVGYYMDSILNKIDAEKGI